MHSVFPVQTQWDVACGCMCFEKPSEEQKTGNNQWSLVQNSFNPRSKWIHDEGVWWGCKCLMQKNIFMETMMQYYRRSVTLLFFIHIFYSSETGLKENAGAILSLFAILVYILQSILCAIRFFK